MQPRIISVRVHCFKQDYLDIMQECRRIFGNVRMILLDETLRGSLEETEQRRVVFFSRNLSAVDDEFESTPEVSAEELQNMLSSVGQHLKVHTVEYHFDGLHLC